MKSVQYRAYLRMVLGICLIACSAFLSTAYSSDVSIDSASDRLENQLKQIVAFSASFSQISWSANEKNHPTQIGQFVWVPPNRFRWQVKQPFKQLIISNGHLLWSYDEDLMEVIVHRIEHAQTQVPLLLFLNHFQELSACYQIINKKRVDGFQVFHLYQNKNNQDKECLPLQSIDLLFFKGDIHEVLLTDMTGTHVQVTLTKINHHPDYQSDWFQIKLPPEVEVIADPGIFFDGKHWQIK